MAKAKTSADLPDSAVEFCTRTIRGFEKKADHNKKESLACFIAVISCTLATPIFVTLGSTIFIGKIVPSILSLGAAAATAWLQLRKPQQLWALYRSCQRELEDHRAKHHFAIEPYNEDECDRILATKVAEVAMTAHHGWVLLIPSPEHLSSSGEHGEKLIIRQGGLRAK
jgi:SMODS and SLOG-associating 2TM effector domain 1